MSIIVMIVTHSITVAPLSNRYHSIHVNYDLVKHGLVVLVDHRYTEYPLSKCKRVSLFHRFQGGERSEPTLWLFAVLQGNPDTELTRRLLVHRQNLGCNRQCPS